MLMRILAEGHVIIGSLTWEILGLMVLFAVCCTIAKALPHMKHKGPKIQCHAMAKSKRIERANAPQVRWGDQWDQLITFIKDDGSEVELFTGEANYRMFDDGDKGTLTYQGDKLIEFVWDK